MLFNSYIFVLVFLPISLAGWHILNKLNKCKLALAFLLAMSLWFYGYFNIKYLFIIVFSMLGNYILSTFQAYCEKRSLGQTKENNATCKENGGNDSIPAKIRKIRKFTMIAGIILNLGILFYFKYFDFFIENINSLFKSNLALHNILAATGYQFFYISAVILYC